MHVDLVIRGGRVIDGTCAPATPAEVALAGDRIVGVGTLDELPAARTIDADGLLVCPGFVDMHTHSDLRLLSDPPTRRRSARA